MEISEAYQVVLKDMIDSGCGLLVGKYDARNGSDTFMHGICTVMEWIAYHAGEEYGEEFSDVFTENMAESERRASDA